MKGLPLSDIVNVEVSLSPLAAQSRNFGALLIVGTSEVITVDERIRRYTSLEAVADDFGINAEEYQASVAYFSQQPKPNTLFIGRWANTKSANKKTDDTSESLLDAIKALSNHSNDWYGLVIANLSPSQDDLLAVAQWIEASSTSRLLALTSADKNIVDELNKDDFASQLEANKLSRTLIQYSTTNPYAAASLLGRAFTVNFNGNRTAITLKFKKEPLIKAESLTISQARALKNKNTNVFVQYDNETAIIQQGVMCNGDFIDERHGLDWLQNYVQSNLYNLLYTSSTKIPQTEAGVTQLIANIERSLNQAVNNGLLAPGIWNGGAVGQLNGGDALTKGYYIYSQPIDEQDLADRTARKAPLIQVACKLAGAVHYVDVLINVVR